MSARGKEGDEEYDEQQPMHTADSDEDDSGDDEQHKRERASSSTAGKAAAAAAASGDKRKIQSLISSDEEEKAAAAASSSTAAAATASQPPPQTPKKLGKWSLKEDLELCSSVQKYVSEHQGMLPGPVKTTKNAIISPQWKEIAKGVEKVTGQTPDAAAKACSNRWTKVRGDLKVSTHTRE